MQRRQFTAFTASALCAAALPAAAQPAWPSKPVTIMVPYPAGGTSDGAARMYGTLLSNRLKQTVLVENLGGVSGGLAGQRVLSAPADGHMLFYGSPNEVILAPIVNNAVKYKPQDFTLVQATGIAAIVVLTRKDLPVNSIDELIALARKASAEGKPLSYGTTGLGSMYHLVTESLSKRIGASFNHVPYKGGAPILQDLAGGQIDFSITAYQAALDAMVEQGRLKMLATLEPKRPETLKHVPTLSEAKNAPLSDFAYNIWGGFFVKTGTPESVIERLRELIADARNDPAALAYRQSARSLELPTLTGSEITKFFEREVSRLQALTRNVKLTMT